MKVAIETSNVDLAKKLLKDGADPNMVDQEPSNKSHHSILILAISLKETDIARSLIEHGADVDTIYMNYDDDNLCIYALTAMNTARLIYEAEPKPSIGEVMHLIEQKLKTYNGRQPKRIPPGNLPDELPPQVLIDAVREGDLNSVELLLQNGGDVNTIVRDSEGLSQHSILVTAITLEHTDIAKLLIKHGAEVDTIFQNFDDEEKAVYEVTALHAAQSMHDAFPKLGMGAVIEQIETKLNRKKKQPTVVVAHNVPIILRRRGPNVIQSSDRPVPTITFDHVEDIEDIDELNDNTKQSTAKTENSQNHDGKGSDNTVKSSKMCTIL
ncbi:uncharacterized protein LOC144447193 [Glandiceps talaboti]